MNHVAETMVTHGWTAKEVELAVQHILTSPKLIKELSYTRSSLYAVLAMARGDIRVRRGRLFTPAEYTELTTPPAASTKQKDLLRSCFRPGVDPHGGAKFYLARIDRFMRIDNTLRRAA